MRNLYEVLGVNKTADPAEIRKSFKKLAKENHPDLNQSDAKAPERFKEISAAYEVLGDEEKRAWYDEFGEVSLKPGFDPNRARAWKHQGGGMGGFPGGFGFDGGGGGMDIDEIFGSLFSGGGRGGRRRGPARGTDVEATLSVGLVEALRGEAQVVSVRRPQGCPSCHGDGGTGKVACSNCGGTGHARMNNFGRTMLVPCNQCGGAGHSFAAECDHCGGTGRLLGEERLRIKMPDGVDDGQVIRLRGKGGEGRAGGPAGDLLLTIHLLPHPLLRREGEDLYLDLPLSLTEAMAGARIEVPTPEGGTVRVKVPAGAANGQKLRLRGKGVGKGDQKGDLFLVLRPSPPPTEDPEALALAEQLEAFRKEEVRAGFTL